jgi:TfoX/Sxy family transcriptional regulator of competence genes
LAYIRARIWNAWAPPSAYLLVKRGGFRASLNLLYALAATLLDVRWNKLPHAERSRLILEVDALEDAQKNRR